MGNFVTGTEKALPVTNVEESSPRPAWRIRRPLNQQNVRTWRWSGRKNKKYNVRTRNVYENKENLDIMPDEKSDIYVDPTCILQKTAVLRGQFIPNGSFAHGFLPNFTFNRHIGTRIRKGENL
jgi:hypothetical protein